MTTTGDILVESKNWTLLVDGECVHMHVRHHGTDYFNGVNASALWEAVNDLDLTKKNVEIICPRDGDGADYWARFLKLHRFRVKRRTSQASTREVSTALRNLWALQTATMH